MQKFDLIVIGTGPAGEKAAVKAAYFGHKVALIEKEKVFGGAEVVTGTLPSKTLKETALYFSGKYENHLPKITNSKSFRCLSKLLRPVFNAYDTSSTTKSKAAITWATQPRALPE